MRLINTKTLEMREFFDSDIPEYAILSHRWGQEEVSFQEFCQDPHERSEGCRKVIQFCQLVWHQYHYYWAWVDTCCIDKTSSTELSEAINSMFRWYENAQQCIVYLSDVVHNRDVQRSQWFTRGWTLQELLAPHYVDFYDRHWHRLGSRADLINTIHSVTEIAPDILADCKSCSQLLRSQHCEYGHRILKSTPIAVRMAWAARRKTSRIEDKAYCLLGLFDVNMPLLYGEGHKAFHRLQQEIIKVSDDESIFAWGFGVFASGLLPRDLFAGSPADFISSVSVQRLEGALGARRPYQVTNKGLQFHAHLLKGPFPDTYCMPIKCTRYSGSGLPGLLTLCQNGPSANSNTYTLAYGFHELSIEQWHRILPEGDEGSILERLERLPTQEIYIKLYVRLARYQPLLQTESLVLWV